MKDDPCALVGERFGDHLADAAIGAGHESDFTGDFGINHDCVSC